MFFRTVVDHSGADLKFELLEQGIPDLGQQFIEQGSAIGEQDLIANVPVKTGFLRSTVGRVVSYFRAEIFTASGYGKAVNDGYPAHIIRAKNANFLRFEVNGHVVFRKQVLHPGFAGHHFKERTVEGMIPKLDSLGESLLQDLKKKVDG